MKKKQSILRMAMSLVTLMLPLFYASAWEWEWTDNWNEAVARCEECGSEYTFYAESTDEAEEIAAEFFCEDCGSCSLDVNEDCYHSHHCENCWGCIDNGEYHEGAYNKLNMYICYDCWDELAEDGELSDVCSYCHELFGEGVAECNCEYSMLVPHCTDCSEEVCEKCHICLVIDGEETEALTGDACAEHNICASCMEEAAAEDDIHCRVCFMCDEDICDECGLCESCAAYEEHCPECGHCFGGDDIQWCASGGEHCIHCCEENDWLCGECGKCTDGAGLDLCYDCGLCESCCHANSESEGCEHGYCIASADYEDHLCPECGQCPQDEECEDCGLCQDCQQDYHCEHGLCPDGSEWDDHLCPDCGECFELDELCEYCGLCESCNEHCEHDICPLNDDEGDHFICDQCGECFEGNQCDYCGLCEDCCHDNTVDRGCDHDLCVESDEFAEHWCYEDDQCLELCNHDADCAHLNVSTTWSMDGTAHWHVCEDCGIAMNKAIHTEGTPVTLTSPNPNNHTNGTALVSCSVCNTQMSIISIPYVEVPTDGKPYILIQPTDYTGKTNTSAYLDVPQRYSTFKVKAGGEGLSYQWYRKYGDGYRAVEDDTPDEDGFYQHAGAQTATLKAIVATDACDDYVQQFSKYYCVISNEHGSVTSDIVTIKAQHVFGRYFRVDDETHDNLCFGECSASKGFSKHRFDAWVLVRPATESETGLLEQKCLDCNAKITEVIPKVEPGHVHSYNIVKHSVTQHWFVCSCGLSDPNGVAEDHVFDQTEVITEATENNMGENKVTCSACGYSKTVKVDKLPHTHDWYSFNDPDMFIVGAHGRYVDPEKGGWGLNSHHVKCKGCDQKKTEEHTWRGWLCTEAPSIRTRGKMEDVCTVCKYTRYKLFPHDQYPITIVGGKADVDYAAPGTVVNITYDMKYGEEEGRKTFPRTYYKFKKWEDGRTHTGYTTIPWGDGHINLPAIEFASATSAGTFFTMPDGPAIIFATLAKCSHRGLTIMSERVEPTCLGYGHEPNEICADCGKIFTEGARIEALGHDLPSTPIEGTEHVEYCSIWSQYGYNNGIPNTATHGWSGDFLCNRCGAKVKSEKTPLRHGLWDKNNQYGPNPGKIWTNYQRWEPSANPPTCTKAGYDDDLYCKYCNKRVIKGERQNALGHEWGEWQTIREATTKIKGMEQRVCERDPSHIETRITDYSGPDYTLKADKTKLNFEWVFGEQPAPQTVTFRSAGRNNVLALAAAEEYHIGDALDLSISGMTLTVTPNLSIGDVLLGNPAIAEVSEVLTDEGNTTTFNAPEIEVCFNVKKTEQKYNLTIIDGYAMPVDDRWQIAGDRKSMLNLRGGDRFRLEPKDEVKDDFISWEIVEDASGMLATFLDTEWKNANWLMSPNNVIIRAVYKLPGDIVVSGTQVTNVNKDNVLGDGTVRYVPKTKTLTLNNAHIFATEVGGISANTADMKINLTGHSSINAGNTYAGMALRTTGYGPVTFLGGGSLDIIAGGMGIVTWHDIVLKDGVRLLVESIGGNCGLQGRRAGATPLPTLTMSGSGTMLMAKGGMASIQNFHTFDLSDDIVIIEPTGATLVEDVGVIGADNALVTNQWVIIANLEDYITSIKSISGSPEEDENLYNLSGQRVSDSYNGIVIQDGRKVLKK